MVSRPVGSLAALAVVSVLLVACGSATPPPQASPTPTSPTPVPSSPSPSGPPAAAVESPTPDPPALSVVVTVETVADLVAEVAGERVEVTSLVPAGADAHTYEPRPRDVVQLAEADAFLGIGLDLNPAAVALAEESLPQDAPVVLLGDRLDPERLIFDHTHDDDTDHTHDDGHTHDDVGHTHDDVGPNPHVWTSVRVTVDLVDHIAAALVSLDPDGEQHYLDAAATYIEQLDDLDLRIQEAVDTIPAEARTLVAYHDAWSYFARDYGLEMVTAVQPSDYAEPSAADVRAVIDLIREHDVPAVFGSEVFPTGVLDTIATETGATYVGDLADDVLPGEPGTPEHSYLELMRQNAVRIVEALGGDASALR